MSRPWRKVQVTFSLYVDPTEYTDPASWKLNDIFGFTSFKDCGARITGVEMKTLGTGAGKTDDESCQQTT